MILVTGGAGFIGANFVLDWIAHETGAVINLDKLTYAGNLNNLASIQDHPRHIFVHGDIADRALLKRLLQRYQPRALINFAAESHVDRSISGPEDFIQTNIVGTFHLLEEVRAYWSGLNAVARDEFRFLHVSTDEVYGSLTLEEQPFTESSPYRPNSPYAASKAAADHLVRAYHHTYGVPALTTNCSNNYGPYQFPEKLIPLTILNALQGKPLPIYGDGLNIRDWLYVGDHCAAIRAVLARGRIGETYNIGGSNEKSNLEVVRTICAILDELKPLTGSAPLALLSPSPIAHYASLITYVKDRAGHDRRYAIEADKLGQLGWQPEQNFTTGIRHTVQWYLDNMAWVEGVTSGGYQKWIAKQYGEA